MTTKPKGKSIFDAMGLDGGADSAPIVPPTPKTVVAVGAKAAVPAISGKPMEVPLAAVEADPNQPRRDFDAEKLEALAASIREVGVLQPVIVRRAANAEGRFIVIDGERRLRASVLAEVEKLPVIVRDDFDQEETRRLYVQTIANAHSAELTDLETARVIDRLVKEGFKKGEFIELGIRANRVAGYLAMLEHDVLPHVEAGIIKHARVAGEFASLDGEGKSRALRLASEAGGVVTLGIVERARYPEPSPSIDGGEEGSPEQEGQGAPKGAKEKAPKPPKAPTSVKLQLSVDGLRRLAETLGEGESVDVVLTVVRGEALVGELGSHIDTAEEDLGSRLRDLLNAG